MRSARPLTSAFKQVNGWRSNGETPMFSATDMRAHAGVAQRLVGQAADLEAAHLDALGACRAAPLTAIFPALALPLAGQHLDQLLLPVARHAGDADDLAGAHAQATARSPPASRDRRRRDSASISSTTGSRGRAAWRVPVARGRLVADHHLAPSRRGSGRATRPLAGQAGPGAARSPRRRTAITSRNLCEIIRTVSRPSCAIPRSRPSTSSASAGVSTEVGSSRITIELPQVELLQDLQLLLLAGGQHAHRPVRIELERHRLHERRATAFVSAAQSKTNGMLAARQHQVLGHRHVVDQREVLVDHADAQRVRRRAGS